ncbi:MAG: hydrogenase nickel incorporation protein HypB [Gammaproteobacteria bacterium]
MCETCGCAITDKGDGAGNLKRDRMDGHTVDVLESLLADNDHAAAHNREHFGRHGVLAINLMSAPGSGKTALLEATIRALAARGDGALRVAVIEGDLATENDAERIRRQGAPAVQIATGSACHLDAHMVHDALHEMSLDDIDILFIENVGNLVCPASFDLGQHANVTLVSVPEGDDKPAKYPVMFRASDLVLISKADLLEYMPEFDPDRAREAVRTVGNAAPIFEIAATRGRGLDEWFTWLEEQRGRLDELAAQARGSTGEGHHGHAHAHHAHSPDSESEAAVTVTAGREA